MKIAIEIYTSEPAGPAESERGRQARLNAAAELLRDIGSHVATCAPGPGYSNSFERVGIRGRVEISATSAPARPANTRPSVARAGG
jgi:hypothetical protein